MGNWKRHPMDRQLLARDSMEQEMLGGYQGGSLGGGQQLRSIKPQKYVSAPAPPTWVTRTSGGGGMGAASTGGAPPPPPAYPMPGGFGGGGFGGIPGGGGGGFGGGGGGWRGKIDAYGGGGGGGDIAAPQLQSQAELQMPEYQEAPGLREAVNQLGDYAGGMMDPESEYYQRLSEGMQEQIGGQSAAQQRAAALRGAYGGFGAGGGAEQMQTAADISQAGLEAQGQAEAGLRLAAPQMGAQALQQTFGPLGQMGQMQEGARQFGVGAGLQQQQQAAEQAWRQAQLEMQAQQMAHQQSMQQLGMLF